MTGLPSYATLLDAAALLVVVGGIVSAAIVLVRLRDLLAALRTILDFWLAASLLALSSPPEPAELITTALIVGVQQLLAWAVENRPVRFGDLFGRRGREPDPGP